MRIIKSLVNIVCILLVIVTTPVWLPVMVLAIGIQLLREATYPKSIKGEKWIWE